MNAAHDIYGSRIEEPEEELKDMTAFRGSCSHCSGVILMSLTSTGEMNPDGCQCIQCGQRYFMKINDRATWEAEQWAQKEKKWRDEK